MAHKEWCGKPCCDCSKPCSLDESIPCSPDCNALNPDGTRDINVCLENGCDAVELHKGVNYAG